MVGKRANASGETTCARACSCVRPGCRCWKRLIILSSSPLAPCRPRELALARCRITLRRRLWMVSGARQVADGHARVRFACSLVCTCRTNPSLSLVIAAPSPGFCPPSFLLRLRELRKYPLFLGWGSAHAALARRPGVMDGRTVVPAPHHPVLPRGRGGRWPPPCPDAAECAGYCHRRRQRPALDAFVRV